MNKLLQGYSNTADKNQPCSQILLCYCRLASSLIQRLGGICSFSRATMLLFARLIAALNPTKYHAAFRSTHRCAQSYPVPCCSSLDRSTFTSPWFDEFDAMRIRFFSNNTPASHCRSLLPSQSHLFCVLLNLLPLFRRFAQRLSIFIIMSVKHKSHGDGPSVVWAATKISLSSSVTLILNQHKSLMTCTLTDEELVLLALADSADKSLKVTHIGEFIITRVRYYTTQSAKYFFAAMSGHSAGYSVLSLAARTREYDPFYSSDPKHFADLASRYLCSYGIPVHVELNEHNQKVYRMTSGAAYAFIQKCFGKYEALKKFKSAQTEPSALTDPASCPLMKLPVELRLKIYRLVLKATGFRLRVGRGTFLAYEEKVPVWASTSQNIFTMPRISKMLALLSVSKQIHSEAMPEFYRENHFEFLDMSCLKSFLTNIGTERRKFIRNITVRYLGISTAAAGAKLLTQSDTLQKLTLIMSVSQDPAGHYTIDSSRRKFPSLAQIPGFTALKRLRGIKQLAFNPELEHNVVDAFLRPFITQPKVVKAKKTKNSNKRKLKDLGTNDSDHDARQPSSKKTKA
ncbi:hypothetical protein D6C87_07087 [Aureobasidium pullulans]|uniref:DUF7730 domain-containing protein n=1 Tax=Aureobasidium pullulans TaxID=5580 RepID=A0AB38MAQ6_AURPU|nr:hypothetical protein D6C94_00736 [Aureobasidium pullulans]THZ39501.1 hypothetical protein D6C87_07087 [Aureobasidium pullulans]